MDVPVDCERYENASLLLVAASRYANEKHLRMVESF